MSSVHGCLAMLQGCLAATPTMLGCPAALQGNSIFAWLPGSITTKPGCPAAHEVASPMPACQALSVTSTWLSSSALGWPYPCLAAKPHIQKHTRKQQVAPPIARHNLPGMRSQRKGLAAGRGCRVPLLQRRFLCRSLMGCLLSFMHPACQAGQPLTLLEDLGATGLQVQAASMLA